MKVMLICLIQQNDGNDESDTMLNITIEEHLTSHGKMIKADIKKLTITFSLTEIVLFILKKVTNSKCYKVQIENCKTKHFCGVSVF